MKTLLKTELLIIIFLWINVIFSLYRLQSAEIFMIAGIIGLTITSILFKLNNKLCIFLLAILLALGTINLVSFNDSFQVNFMGFFNILNFLIFMILIFNKRSVFSELYENWFGTSKEEYVERRKSQVKFFKRRFENLSDDELKNKLNENIVFEAKVAIKEILQERK